MKYKVNTFLIQEFLINYITNYNEFLNIYLFVIWVVFINKIILLVKDKGTCNDINIYVVSF